MAERLLFESRCWRMVENLVGFFLLRLSILSSWFTHSINIILWLTSWFNPSRLFFPVDHNPFSTFFQFIESFVFDLQYSSSCPRWCWCRNADVFSTITWSEFQQSALMRWMISRDYRFTSSWIGSWWISLQITRSGILASINQFLVKIRVDAAKSSE